MNVLKRTARGKSPARVFTLRPPSGQTVCAKTTRLFLVLDIDGEHQREITAPDLGSAAHTYMLEEFGEHALYVARRTGLDRMEVRCMGQRFRITEAVAFDRDQVLRAFASDRAPIHPLCRRDAAA